MTRRFSTAAAFGLLSLAASSPAFADHPVAGGGISGGGPVTTTGAATLPRGTFAVGLQVSYAEPDGYSDADLVALAGDHVHAHTSDYSLLTRVSLAYGVTSHFTLGASLPYLRRDDLRAGEHSHANGVTTNSVEELGSVSGIGDVSLLGQYQFAHSHKQGWGLALLAGIKLPTGSTHRLSRGGERLETEHQPGTGSWDPLLGLAASKAWGALALDASLLYQVSTIGAQQTRLGDRLSANLALSYRLSGGEEHHAAGAPHHDHASWTLFLETNGEWEGRQRVDGAIEEDSGGKALYLSPGLRYGAPGGWTAALSAGLPVWQRIRPSHPDNRFRLVAQVGTSF